MIRTRPRRAVKLAAVLAVVAGLFVTGCGQVRAGAAALVGDQRIAIEELSQSVEATAAAAAENNLRVTDRGALVRAVLSRQITGVLLEAAAQRHGISVTRGEVDRQIAQSGGRKRLEMQMLRSAVAPEDLRSFMRHQIIRRQLAQEVSQGGGPRAQQEALMKYLQKTARRLDITVSPRYGSFNAGQLRVVQEKSQLSTPDPDSQPTAGLSEPAGSGSSG